MIISLLPWASDHQSDSAWPGKRLPRGQRHDQRDLWPLGWAPPDRPLSPAFLSATSWCLCSLGSLPSCPGPGGSSSTGTGGTVTECSVAPDPGGWPSRGGSRARPRQRGDRHDRYRCHSPGGTGRLTWTSQHAACPAAPGQSCRARTGDLLQITKALLIRDRMIDACVTAGQTANRPADLAPQNAPHEGKRSSVLRSKLCI